MKAVWAYRETTCNECRQIIPPGSRRLDDMARRGPQVLRFHYHPGCAIQRFETFWDTHTFEPRRGTGGRRAFDLSPEDRAERRKVLNRLSAIKQYYLPRLNLAAKIDELTPPELKRFRRFQEARQRCISALERLGGVPPQYLHTPSTPTLGELTRTTPPRDADAAEGRD